jgi:tRNA-uridine 2-sulfurtransferase
MTLEDKKNIVVAMSGGVDSSVAAVVLATEGHSVLGVSMQVWDYRQNGGNKSRATCCAPTDFNDARNVADKFGIPYYVFDFEESFKEQVIDKFVTSYLNGLTPNPCIECNRKVKFKELRLRAQKFGYTHVATGHYAQIVESDGEYKLLRGADEEKDQSYFLFGLPYEDLKTTLFPVGHLDKSKVRELAQKYELSVANKSESQDICFVQGSVGDFVAKIGRRDKSSGKVVNTKGDFLGNHEGIHNFTVGQRKGLGIGGASEPLYVVNIDSANATVTLGTKQNLEKQSFLINDVNVLAHNRLLEGSLEGVVQVRSRHKGTKAKVTLMSDNSAKVEFIDTPVPTAPGQAAVLYDALNQQVILGGTITHSQL